MKTSDDEGKLDHHAFQYRHQVSFSYLLHRGYYFPLRYLVHSIDVVYPFVAIEVPLVNCVYPNITRLPLGVRLRPLSNPGYSWFCLDKSPGYVSVDITSS